jgi:ATP-dependent helicase/nuclease subunit A
MLKKGLNIDFNKDLFKVQGSLTFLVNQEGRYYNVDKMIEVNVPISKNIQLNNLPEIESSAIAEKNLKIRSIDDHISGDIVSATKFSVFTQCPMKYFFRFEIGLILSGNNYILPDNDYRDDEIELDSRLKGRVIHKLLEENINKEDLNSQIQLILDKEKISPNEKKVLSNEILQDLNKYISSEMYKEISIAESFKNEYEVYLKMEEFYLYGRIDKVIFEENKIKIIDYKTDNINPKDISSRKEQYLSQVKFYSYILSRFYPQIHNYELQIVYIKNPDAKLKFEINGKDFPGIENEINNMLNSLRTRNFVSDFDLCKECIYSVNKIKCIKEQSAPIRK